MKAGSAVMFMILIIPVYPIFADSQDPEMNPYNHAPENNNNIEIQPIQISPSIIHVGDTFTITSTLVNNSTVPIILDGGACVPVSDVTPFFTVTLDNHTKINEKNLNCAGVGLYKMLNPGESMTGTSPDSTVTYAATEAGTANVTVAFSYHVKNQADPAQPDSRHIVSKSIQFTVYDKSASKTGNVYGPGGPAVTITLDPLQQFKSGIDLDAIKCSDGLQAVVRYQDKMPLCVRFEHIQEMQKRGLNLLLYVMDSHPPELTVDGLKDSYRVGDKIDFTIKFDGVGYPCSSPLVFVTSDHGKILWTSRIPVSFCDPDAKVGHEKVSWRLSDLGDLRLTDPSGSHRLVIFFNNKTLTQDFWTVSQVSTIDIPKGFSENNTGFEPKTMTVKIGQNETVRWLNHDISEHTIIADNMLDSGFYEATHSGSFYNSTIKPGKYFEYNLLTPGKIRYGSESGINGTIIVLPPGGQLIELQIQHPEPPPYQHRYSNDEIPIFKGAKVSWENMDNVTHTITSKDGMFDSGPVPPRTRFILDTTTLTPGYYDYFDKLNPTLSGGIRIVEPLANESYNQLLMEKARNAKESQLFLEKYPDALAYVQNDYYDVVNFSVEKQVYPAGMTDDGKRSLRLAVTFGRNHDLQNVFIECGGPVSLVASNVTGYLESGNCFNPK